MSLPHDDEAERGVLASVFISNHVALRLASELQMDDFYLFMNRHVFTAIVALCEANAEITPLTVDQHLKAVADGGDLSRHSFVSYCGSLLNFPVLGSLEPYIATLKAQSTLRRILRLAESATKRADAGDDAHEILRDLEDSVGEIRQRAGVQTSSFRPMSEVMKETEAQLVRLRNGDTDAIPTGFKALDQITRGGIQRGDVWVIASLTGRGKSSWALGAARYQAEQGIPVAVVSREMSDFENSARMLSAAASFPAWKIEPGLSPNNYQWLMDWVPHLAGLPLWFNSRTGNIFEIRSQVKQLVKNHGVRSLFVDYLQLMNVTLETKNSTRAQEVATVSRVLKEIAMENQIGVFALAQFNRQGAHGELPELHHLAESSGIEKDASLVLVLDMEKPKDGVSERACTMRIAKHRNGPTLPLKFIYRGDILTFQEAA